VSKAKRLKALEDESVQFKRVLADAMPDNVARLVKHQGTSERRACNSMGCYVAIRYRTSHHHAETSLDE
jgi:hypothetical protein